MVPAAAGAFALLAVLVADRGVAGLWNLSASSYAVLGAWPRLGFMAGELPNSFIKRQLDIPPGGAPHSRSAACNLPGTGSTRASACSRQSASPCRRRCRRGFTCCSSARRFTGRSASSCSASGSNRGPHERDRAQGRHADLAQVGGKAANLARLIAAGAPVPDGFVLTNTALQHFVAERRRPPDVARRHGGGRLGSRWPSSSAAPRLVRTPKKPPLRASSTPFRTSRRPKDSGRRSPRFGRRSGPHASLAYQSSRHTSRHGCRHSAPGGCRGVGRALHRLTDRPGGDAPRVLRRPRRCAGLGAINPGRVTIARKGFPGWRWTTTCRARGTVHQRVAAAQRSADRAAGRLALDIEQAFGAPQDIEWTIDPRAGSGSCRRGRSPSPDSQRQRRPRGSGVLWTNANVNENFPHPICPLLYSIARAGYYHYFRNLGQPSASPQAADADGACPSPDHRRPWRADVLQPHEHPRGAPARAVRRPARGRVQPVHRRRSGRQAARLLARRVTTRAGPRVAIIAARTTWQYLFLTRRVEQFEATWTSSRHARTPRTRDSPLPDLLADFRGFLDIRCHGWKNASLADAGAMVCYGALAAVPGAACPGRPAGAAQHAAQSTAGPGEQRPAA